MAITPSLPFCMGGSSSYPRPVGGQLGTHGGHEGSLVPQQLWDLHGCCLTSAPEDTELKCRVHLQTLKPEMAMSLLTDLLVETFASYFGLLTNYTPYHPEAKESSCPGLLFLNCPARGYFFFFLTETLGSDHGEMRPWDLLTSLLDPPCCLQSFNYTLFGLVKVPLNGMETAGPLDRENWGLWTYRLPGFLMTLK